MSAAPAADAPMLTIPSRLFGPLQVSPEAIVRFPDGLFAFAGEREFVLLPTRPDGLFWLQDTRDSTLAFLLADPCLFLPVLEPALGEAVAAHLAEREAAVLVIVTLPSGPAQPATANTLAPVLIDLATRVGRQVVLEGAAFAVRQEIAIPGIV